MKHRGADADGPAVRPTFFRVFPTTLADTDYLG